jgi:sugar phosphate isomerase/epimerase
MQTYSRRDFTKLALATVPAVGLAGALSPTRLLAADAKPNSRFAGVQIGLNVPYSFGNPLMSGDDILANCVNLGFSGLELRLQPIESFLGIPADLVPSRGAVPAGAAGAAAAAKLSDWRKSVSMSKVAAFRSRYEAAGVSIDILKVDNIFKMSDAELDYAFNVAKAAGARAISTEITKHDDPKCNENHRRVGAFADKHQFPVGYHGHAATTPAHWEEAFGLAKFNYANVDLGHFVAGNNASPVDFIKRHHARITHVHVKDRTKNNGGNTPFGQGDTPIVEVLRLIRDNRWNIQATIEFEYKVPADSDRMKELAKTLKYCRDALV